eukprot:TRINITY_DN5971_c0_g1_i1.p1 TRINITY_DN5971_c0_g1~~TRINITY_DN5971_c0_g1_i1.p1  ORF type:complete len:467 (-),score=107.99 TRINITY_DN5971_c0_g1_i1:136-1536(-)
MRKILPIILIIFAIFHESEALIHHLKIRNDNRRAFFIENFGFERAGKLHLTLERFTGRDGKLNMTLDGSASGEDVGFLIRKTETDSSAFTENSLGEGCLSKISTKNGDERVFILLNQANNFVFTFDQTIKSGEEGLYNTYFVGCKSTLSPISFDLNLTQYNIDRRGNRNYLSSGYSPLPTIYGVFVIAHTAVLIVWVFGFLIPSSADVNRMHLMMTLLVFLKMMSLFFQTVDQYFVKSTGSPSPIWSIPFYIFAGLKGVILFALIALIGSGYQFVKPFLHDREKRIFMLVIPLQVIDNIAMIIVEETAPGSLGWISWQHIFKIVDIICCAAIVVPIFWSIRHLREAAQIDGKAAISVKRLSLFRHFYLVVISYIYFTRIIIYLIEATLQFRMIWLGHLCSEAATIIFFCFVGYNFRPTSAQDFLLDDAEEMAAMKNEEREKIIVIQAFLSGGHLLHLLHSYYHLFN